MLGAGASLSGGLVVMGRAGVVGLGVLRLPLPLFLHRLPRLPLHFDLLLHFFPFLLLHFLFLPLGLLIFGDFVGFGATMIGGS